MDLPLFTLFRTINRGYVYDADWNNIYPISERAYQLLLDLKRGDASLADVERGSQEISGLTRRGLLSTERRRKMGPACLPVMETLLTRRLQKMTLQLAPAAGGGRPSGGPMPPELAKEAILFLREHATDASPVCVGFHGDGSPPEFSTVQEAVAFSEEQLRGKRIRYAVKTSRIPLADGIVPFLSAYKFDLTVCLNGPAEVSGETLEALSHIFQAHPDALRRVSVQLTLRPGDGFDEVNSLLASYSFLRKIRISPVFAGTTDPTMKNTVEECRGPKERYHVFLKYLHFAGRFSAQKCAPVLASCVGNLRYALDPAAAHSPFFDVCAPGGPCVSGEMCLMATAGGDLVPCEWGGEPSSAMTIGNIRGGIDMEKTAALLEAAKAAGARCEGCWAFALCLLRARLDPAGRSSPEARRQCANARESALHKLRQFALVREMKTIYDHSTIV